MKKHPFPPLVFDNTKTLLIGTLPPETAPFYFSNSNNTRLWDILNSIWQNKSEVSTNSNSLKPEVKHNILKDLNLGIYDIILHYDRVNHESTKDIDIIPIKYSNILELVENSKIEKLIFVYRNAAKWFIDSLSNDKPVKINRLKNKIEYGTFKEMAIGKRKISCVLVPSPLNRGKEGETLDHKLEIYRTAIK
jgi:G:T/U-mismatch repair DNA glycosylase